MKKKPAASSGESAPLWVVSFADMVSLLMAFFVMLAWFSAGTKDDTRFRALLKSLQEAFGYQAALDSGGSLGTDAADLVARLEQLAMQNFKAKKDKAGGEKEGMSGRENTVTRIREGIEFTIGGQVSFVAGSADLRPEGKEALAELSQYIRGENNKIEIRGHSTRLEAGEGKLFANEHLLSYARASAVADCLISQGIWTERIRRVDCGSSEPLILRAYDDQAKSANRRVEIIVTQALVQQFQGGEEGEPPAPEPPAPSAVAMEKTH